MFYIELIVLNYPINLKVMRSDIGVLEMAAYGSSLKRFINVG
jgi:hypothetical protein